jgi:DNA-binding beta-propeller fold protein YncE
VFAAVARAGGAEIRVIDCETNAFVRTFALPAGAAVADLAISPDGEALYALNYNARELLMVNPQAGQTIATAAGPANVNFSNTARMAGSPNGDLLFVQGGAGIQVFDTLTRTWAGTGPGSSSGPLAIHPDGREYYTAGFASATRARVDITEIATLTIGGRIDLPDGQFITDLALNFDGAWLAVTTNRGLHIVNTRRRTITESMMRPAGSTGALSFFVRMPQ